MFNGHIDITLYLNDILLKTLTGQGDSDSHVLTLFSLVLQLKSTNILLLGVREGGTTLPLLLGASVVNGKLTSVDINLTMFVPPLLLLQN